MYIFLNVSGIWSYSEHSIIIFERPENILSEEKLPMCGCAQSHMYKVAMYCRWLVNCLYVCVGVCVCVLIVVSMVMRWDTTSRRRGGSLLLNSINLVIHNFVFHICGLPQYLMYHLWLLLWKHIQNFPAIWRLRWMKLKRLHNISRIYKSLLKLANRIFDVVSTTTGGNLVVDALSKNVLKP